MTRTAGGGNPWPQAGGQPGRSDRRPAGTADRRSREPDRRADPRRRRRDDLAARWERRLALPVVLAAAVSVPAVFLTVFGHERVALAGTLLNWASLAVFTAEAAVLFVLTGNRLDWVRQHRWTLAITAVAVPAVALTVAPVQVLRLIQFIGAVRVLRAGRIIKAGRVLARRSGWTGRWRYLPILVGSVLAAVLVAAVLADPSSTTRQLLTEYMGDWPWVVLVLLAGAVLASATFIVLRNRGR